ncbi:MAG: response regulator transcription factor [Clostridiales bacterium]|nr:response regulator transcription factor [Clostridiales bacterium]
MARILIIEDDDDIRNILTQELLKEGYTVDAASDGIEGSHLLGNTPDLVLMDLMLPGLTGEELLPMIPEEIPVIAVSARSSVDDKVELLSGGCVDYITKPFDIKELKARVATHLRKRTASQNVGVLTASDIMLDTTKHEVTISGEEVRLTRTEYAILKILMTDAGNVISKSELLERTSEDTPDLVESSLKVHMSNLRKKLKEIGGKDYIEAVWGIGFKIAL